MVSAARAGGIYRLLPMLHPIGSQRPSVYWRRRALVAAAVAVLLVLTIWLLDSGGGGKPSAAETPSPTPTPRPSSTATAPTTASTHVASSPSATTTSGSGTGTASSTAAPAPCSGTALRISAVAGAVAYQVGAQPVLMLQVVNPGPKPCTQNLADSQVELVVYNGESRVWGSHDCKVAARHRPAHARRRAGGPGQHHLVWAVLAAQVRRKPAARRRRHLHAVCPALRARRDRGRSSRSPDLGRGCSAVPVDDRGLGQPGDAPRAPPGPGSRRRRRQACKSSTDAASSFCRPPKCSTTRSRIAPGIRGTRASSRCPRGLAADVEPLRRPLGSPIARATSVRSSRSVADRAASSASTCSSVLLAAPGRQVVARDQLPVVVDAGHQLLELQRQQPPVGAELDDLADDLVGDTAHHLQPLGDHRGVAHRDQVLDLQRRQRVGDLVQAGLVALQGGDRLVRAGQQLAAAARARTARRPGKG